MSRTVGAIRGIFRPTPFRFGVIAGLAVALAFYLLASPVAHNVEARTVGADVTRHGGRQIIVRNEQGLVLTARCNGACDDLWYRLKAEGDNSYWVEAKDANGRCVACGVGPYVSGGILGARWRWTLSGAEALNGEAQPIGRW